MSNQKGAVHILFLVTAIGILAFLFISNSGYFKSGLFNQLFPKTASFASGPGIVLFDLSNQPITQTSTANIRVSLTSPWAPTLGFSLVKEVFAQNSPSFKRLNLTRTKPSPTPTKTPIPTSVPTPTSAPTPILPKTSSAQIAEDSNFTQNVKVIAPFISNPTVVDYTLSSTGNKIIYAKFTADNGQTQIYQASINYTSVISTGVSLEYGSWKPNATYDTCTKAEHDSFFVIGEDGKKYSTWHPSIYHRSDGTTCSFGHEHGDDPRTSKADSSLPAFGYAAEQMGMLEPHVGFKVHVLNVGDSTIEGVNSKFDARSVIHMGTGGVKRYVTQMHSVEYDLVYRDGSGKYAHVNTMVDTGPTDQDGSTCDVPRRGAKDFSTVGCNDTYEIWNGMFVKVIDLSDQFGDELGYARFAGGSVIAVFDPITTRDPSDNTRLLYSQDYYATVSNPPAGFQTGLDPLPPSSQFRGCKREVYFGPNYWNNAGKPTVYYTNADGTVKSQSPGPNLIKQEVSAHEYTPIVDGATGVRDVFKLNREFCENSIHTPN